MKGKDGIDQLIKVCEVLSEYCIVNKSCGLHIHCGLTGEPVYDKDVMKNIIAIYDHFRPRLNAMLPKSRRNNRYCKHHSKERISMLFNSVYRSIDSISGRYYSVNTSSYALYGTIEFRQHSGTVTAEKIINWILLMKMIVNRAIQMKNDNIHPLTHYYREMRLELGMGYQLWNYIKERCDYFMRFYEEQIAANQSIAA